MKILATAAGVLLLIGLIAESQVNRAQPAYELATVSANATPDVLDEDGNRVSHAAICYFEPNGCRKDNVRTVRPAKTESEPDNSLSDAAVASAAKLQAQGWELFNTLPRGQGALLFFRRPAKN